MPNKEKQCRAVGRESEAHQVFSVIQSLNFESFSPSQAQLGNEKNPIPILL